MTSLTFLSSLLQLVNKLYNDSSSISRQKCKLGLFFQQAVNIKIHPWYLMVPATLSCSFAYMLPVATPPNAIIFSSGYLKVFDMVT